MAHSPRKSGDKRPFAIFLKEGVAICMRTAKGIAHGVVGSIDAGNWIYPDWRDRGLTVLPGWCRATQVYIDTEKSEVPSTLQGYPVNAR